MFLLCSNIFDVKTRVLTLKNLPTCMRFENAYYVVKLIVSANHLKSCHYNKYALIQRKKFSSYLSLWEIQQILLIFFN